MPSDRPKALDLFCGAGGAAVGLHRAGFEVKGVDINPQPRYPFEFHQADAMEYPPGGYDLIWTSPPCQAYSMASAQWRGSGKEYPDLIATIRDKLKASGAEYIIENVPGAPLINPLKLTGMFFGMKIRRTRLFECSFQAPFALLPLEGPSGIRMGRKPGNNDYITPVGHFSGVEKYRQITGMHWMTQYELSQAIPPAYSEFLGRQAMKVLRAKDADNAR